MQPATEPFFWLLRVLGFYNTKQIVDISHDLCNTFYINAFEHNFEASNVFNCLGVLQEASLPPSYKMGYMESRKK